MRRFLTITLHEFVIQNKINHLTKYLFLFLLFCTLLTLINNPTDTIKSGVIFTIIYLPLAMIGFSNFIFKDDIADGSLELLLTSFDTLELIVAKFLSISISSFLGAMLNVPLIFIFFDLSMNLIIAIIVILGLLLTLTSSLIILIGSIQAYFRSNTQFLTTLIMPLLIPNIIMAGITINENGNLYLTPIMIGIDLIIIPCALILSSYLIKNIYNI